MSQIAITDASVLSWALSTDPVTLLTATVGVGNTRVLPNDIISSGLNGGNYQLTFTQDAVGGRSILFDTNFKVIGEFDTLPNKRTLITIVVQDGEADVIVTPIKTLTNTITLEEARSAGNTYEGNVNYNNNALQNLSALSFNGGPNITWDSTYGAISIPTGSGFSSKIGIDTVFKIHNATGGTLIKGTVVYPDGTSTAGISNVQRCKADTHETISGPIGFIAENINDGADGDVMISGVLTDVDTSLLSTGLLYLSATNEGNYTNTPAEFPNYEVLLGVVDSVHPTAGVITVDISFNVENTFVNFWNGTVRESFDFRVSSNGITTTGALSPSNGHPDLTLKFSDGLLMFQATPDATITLTQGSSTVAQLNYVYVPKSTKILTVSTSSFPLDEHVRIATVALFDHATTQSEGGAFMNRNHNDHVEDTITFQGHLTHITENIRSKPATHVSGANGTLTTNGADVFIAVSAGVVKQLHDQNFPASDMALGDSVHIINDPTAPYKKLTNLNAQTTDSLGGALANSSFKIVVWGVQNKSGEVSHVCVNMPSGSYSKTAPDQAVSDADGYADYSIPSTYMGAGFLISEHVIVLSGGIYSLHSTKDLTGTFPSTVAGGGGAGGGITELTSATDFPSSYSGEGLKLLRVGVGETAVEFVDSQTLPLLVAQLTDFTDNSTNWNTAFSWGDHTGLYSLVSHNHAGVYEPADATILKDADIGVTVQGYNANTTTQGNIFNGVSQLVQTDGSGKLPVLDGSQLTNIPITISDNSITYAKMGDEFTTSDLLITSQISWLKPIYTHTLVINSIFSFTDLEVNKVITLIITGNYTISFPPYAKILSGTYDGSVENYVQLHCTNATASSEEVWITISQPI